jgi:hypothetical protein
MLRSSAIAEMSLVSPLPGTVINLDRRLSDIAFDSAGVGYGCVDQEVYSIDRATGRTTLLPITGPPGFPNTGWPIGVTYDSLRDRVIVATLVGDGYLFSYLPSIQQWAIIDDLDRVDLQSIVHRPANDIFYALPDSRPDFEPIRVIHKYSAKGQSIGSITLSSPIPGVRLPQGEGHYQLMLTTDDRLALLTPRIRDPENPSAPPEVRLYIVDPGSGAILHNSPYPIPEPGTTTAMVAAVVLGLAYRSPARGCWTSSRPHECNSVDGGGTDCEFSRRSSSSSAARAAARFRAALDLPTT